MNSTVEILAVDLAFPEGPAFTRSGVLWCVELLGGTLLRWAPNELIRYATGGRPNGLTIDSKNRVWVCDASQNSVRRFDPTSLIWETMIDAVQGYPLAKPNDLAFEPRGRLLFTCPGDSRVEPTGYVCCLEPDGNVYKIAENLYFPNGLSLVDGGTALVIAETYRQRLWKGTWDSTNGQWVDPEPWADVGGPIGPDGMAFGADGLLYVAVYGSGQIIALDADGGITRAYKVPGTNPTNVAFDPTGELGLVVTEAEQGIIVSLPNLSADCPLFDGGDVWP